MLCAGQVRSKLGSRGATRRELLRIGTLGPVGLSLADLLRLEARGESTPQLTEAGLLPKGEIIEELV